MVRKKSISSDKAEEIATQLGVLSNNSASLESEIQRLQKKQVLILKHVENLHKFLEDRRQSRQCGRVTGESRTGKTVACQAYRMRRLSQRTSETQSFPVVMIQPPTECSSKALFEQILGELHQRFTSGTVAQLRQRTIEALKRYRVEMLIIDEADRIKPKSFADIRDIYDLLGISIMLVGTDRLNAVVKRDEQVHNRFRFKHEVFPLSTEDLVNTVERWEQQILKLSVASNLTQADKLFVLNQHYGKYLGILDDILRAAAIEALRTGKNYIDLETLKKVAQTCI